MANKIPRKTQKIFANAAGNRELTAFGTAMTENPVFTNDPALIQNNAYNYGWEAALTSDKAPYEEDTNALLSMITQQLAYLYQMGTPEYDEETEYFKGSIVLSNDETGTWYKSIADNNIGNALTDSTYWQTVSLGKQGMPLFSKISTGHILQGEDAIGWALQGSLVEASVYPQAYERILTQYNQGTALTYRGISCVQSPDGRFIASLSQKNATDNLFATTGISDFYIIDTSTSSFYLPKTTKFIQYTTEPANVNKYTAAGLPSISVSGQTVTTSSAGSHSHTFSGNKISGSAGIFTSASGGSGALSVSGAGNVNVGSGLWQPWGRALNFSATPTGSISSAGSHTHTVTLSASSASGIYGSSNTVQPATSLQLLYYLVGATAV